MSTSRYCHIYKDNKNSWWLELADREYAGREDATTYGPFANIEGVYRELNIHSNPGGFSLDESGTENPPTKSPNGRPIQKPYWKQQAIYFTGRRYF